MPLLELVRLGDGVRSRSTSGASSASRAVTLSTIWRYRFTIRSLRVPKTFLPTFETTGIAMGLSHTECLENPQQATTHCAGPTANSAGAAVEEAPGGAAQAAAPQDSHGAHDRSHRPPAGTCMPSESMNRSGLAAWTNSTWPIPATETALAKDSPTWRDATGAPVIAGAATRIASTASSAGAPARGVLRDVIVLVVIKDTVYRRAPSMSPHDIKNPLQAVETYDTTTP